MEEMSFWDHLEALRGVIFRSVAAIFIFAIAFFISMPYIFDQVILAPCHGDFHLYRWICEASTFMNQHLGVSLLPEFCESTFEVNLQNIKLASQFFIHMSSSFWLAIIFAFPVIIYQAWSFIAPALYENEKRNVRWAFLFGNIMFYSGVVVGYFLVFPLTLRFLAGYQISATVPNIIGLDSYMNNFYMLILIMGVVFELPLLCWMLSGMGLITKSFFRKYRRYAIVAILVLAAVITPSSDPFTLSVVFVPLYMLYELSAFFVKPDVPQESEEIEV